VDDISLIVVDTDISQVFDLPASSGLDVGVDVQSGGVGAVCEGELVFYHRQARGGIR
jgi:hypothetical protein